MSELTATRVPFDRHTRTLYRLSETVTRIDALGRTVTFDYVVASLDRLGDTCAFPADHTGAILDMLGFGYGMGPGRWLTDDEMDGYVQECIEQHERDGGLACTIYSDEQAMTP